MEGPSLDAVAAMARDLGVGERPDDEVLGYLAGVLADAHDAEEYFGIAASFLPELEDAPAAARARAFQRLSGAGSDPGPGSGPVRTRRDPAPNQSESPRPRRCARDRSRRNRALGVSALTEEFPQEGEASLRKLLFEECGGAVERARDLLLARARARLEEETEAERQEERVMQAVSAESVELLKGVAPHVPESALRRVLALECRLVWPPPGPRRFSAPLTDAGYPRSGDVEAAATRVLEDDVVALDRERRAQAQQRRRAAARQAQREAGRDREARSRVLERFEDEVRSLGVTVLDAAWRLTPRCGGPLVPTQAVAPREEGRLGGAPPPFGMKEVRGGRQGAAKKKKGAGGAQVRYLDGRVVTTKGERYVATKVKEEDPSTFVPLKIKTKGKRGPGYR